MLSWLLLWWWWQRVSVYVYFAGTTLTLDFSSGLLGDHNEEGAKAIGPWCLVYVSGFQTLVYVKNPS